MSHFEEGTGTRIMTHAMFIRRGQTVFLADTSVAENPDGRALADIAELDDEERPLRVLRPEGPHDLILGARDAAELLQLRPTRAPCH